MTQTILTDVGVMLLSAGAVTLMILIAVQIFGNGPDDPPIAAHEAWDEGHLDDLDQFLEAHRFDEQVTAELRHLHYESELTQPMLPAALIGDHHHAPGRQSLRVLFGHRVPPRLDAGRHHLEVAAGATAQRGEVRS